MNLRHQDVMLDSVKDEGKNARRQEEKTKQNSALANDRIETELWDKHWPPSGWPMFESIHQSQGMSTRRCADTGVVHGMSYAVTIDNKDLTDHASPRYSIEINQWSYDNTGQHSHTTPIFLRFRPCVNPIDENTTNALSGLCFDRLRLLKQKNEKQSSLYNTNAALLTAYIISRIDRGIVPDLKRLLRRYKL